MALLSALVALISFSTALSAQSESEPEAVDSDAAMRSMGFAMASQLRLDIGFSDEELQAIFEGMRLAATGSPQPDGYQEAIVQAQQIYMQRMQDFQAKEQQRAAELAQANAAQMDNFFAELDNRDGVQKTASGLRYEMILEGTGKSPAPTDRVKVNYTGTLIDGREFDANDNVEFMVNRVVPGFSEGLQLLKEGGKARLYIPSELGYGNSPARPGSIIQPGDALIFDLELLDVIEIPPPPSAPPPALPEELRKKVMPTDLPKNLPPPPTGPPPSGPPPTEPPTGDIPGPPN